MKTYFFTTLALVISPFFLAPSVTEAKVLYEQSKVGTSYDLMTPYVNVYYGLNTRYPQYIGTGPIYPGGGESYEGTAAWLRVKRISGVACDVLSNVRFLSSDGNTEIGEIGGISQGTSTGPYCDFPITGPNRTNMIPWMISICVDGSCTNRSGDLVLDGSPENKGFVDDGTRSVMQPGGWAFQICDSDGCSGGFNNISTTTATTTATSTPAGASSVLFLPGIMGSRLYEVGQQCGDVGDEQQRWFSTTDCEQLRLRTDSSGMSVNDVYTKGQASAIVDSVNFGPVTVQKLYSTFIESLQNWKDTEIINDFALIPYDWRMRLDHLLKTEKVENGKIVYNPNIDITDSYLYKTLEELAASSTNGKVTIVTHSNGGLLAKTFLATLQNNNDPLISKIDTVILVAAPQLGTPSTLLGMLHGDIIGPAGSIVSYQTTRTLMNTMPFAFHLLPSSQYFSSTGVTVDSPVITFETGGLTTLWANLFGSSITSAEILQRFLSADSGRIKPTVADLTNPEVVPKYLFDNYTQSIHQLMSNWIPPASMKVYQIAGTGLTTQSGITYFTDKECTARDFLKLFKCTAYSDKLGFRPNDVIDGDDTVVSPSALAISDGNANVQRWWLNLKRYNEANVDRVHKDIFEVQDVTNFIKNTLEATTSSPYLYLTNTEPALPDVDRLVFDLHSPLDLSVTTSNGGVISSSSVTVEGAIYKRFGEMQHISMPDTADKKTVSLLGEATGSFTLEIGEQAGNIITQRHTYSAIPSSTSTKVIMELDSAKPIEQALLAVDYDGNGAAEIVYNTIGEVIPEVTYATLKNTVNNLSIKSIYKKLLLENIKIAEQYQIKSLTQTKYKKLELITLNVLKQQVILYERLKVLTPAQKQELIGIIDKLLIK